MQTASILVALGGDLGNTVPKHDVTASEIAVLRAIHGNDAVLDIEPTGDIKRSNLEELSRLRATYGNAKDTENKAIVDVLFPGAAARMFATIDELDLDDTFFKPTARATAAPAVKVEGEAIVEAPKKGRKGTAKAKEPEPEEPGEDDEVEDLDAKESLFK